MKSNSVINRFGDPLWWLIGAASGFIAARFFRNILVVSLATQFRRGIAVTVALCLVTAFFFTRKRFPAIGGISLWLSTFAIGFIRW
jgi:hypothetical protein